MADLDEIIVSGQRDPSWLGEFAALLGLGAYDWAGQAELEAALNAATLEEAPPLTAFVGPVPPIPPPPAVALPIVETVTVTAAAPAVVPAIAALGVVGGAAALFDWLSDRALETAIGRIAPPSVPPTPTTEAPMDEPPGLDWDALARPDLRTQLEAYWERLRNLGFRELFRETFDPFSDIFPTVTVTAPPGSLEFPISFEGGMSPVGVELGLPTDFSVAPAPSPIVSWPFPDLAPGPIAQPFPEPVPIETLPVPAPFPAPTTTPVPAPLPLPGVLADPFPSIGPQPSSPTSPLPSPFPDPLAVPMPGLPAPPPVGLPLPGLPFVGPGPGPANFADPFGSPSPFAQPPRSPPRNRDCDCPKEEKKKKRKRKDRTICYRGTYREFSRGLSKIRKEQVPCQPSK